MKSLSAGLSVHKEALDVHLLDRVNIDLQGCYLNLLQIESFHEDFIWRIARESARVAVIETG